MIGPQLGPSPLRLDFRGAERQLDDKRGAEARPFAHRPNRTSMGNDEVPHDRKAEAEPAMCSSIGRVGLPERLEYLFEL